MVTFDNAYQMRGMAWGGGGGGVGWGVYVANVNITICEMYIDTPALK